MHNLQYIIGLRGLSPFGTSPLQGPLSLHNNGGFGFIFVSDKIFNAFINAKSTVSTFNNTIEVKVYIHECIFWGCSVDTFWEDNLEILIIKYIHN